MRRRGPARAKIVRNIGQGEVDVAPKVAVKREHGALRERIVDELRADIVEGRLAPGTPLRTEEVMERFGVSNSPLREAFAQLAAEGLIKVYRNRGAFVAPLTRDSAADLVRVGALLWETVFRWSIPRLTPGDISSLRRVAGDFDLAQVSGDNVTALLDAERFQDLVAEHCGSPELLRAVAAGGPRLKRLVRMLSPLEQLDAYSVLHSETLAAAKAADPDRAAAAVRTFWDHMAAAVDSVPLEEIAP
jgi:DNA-binding GntR family transcriptional regulator